MNLATKLKIANIFTALASIAAIMQTFLTSPPFTPESIFIGGAVLTYSTLFFTTWKQYLSPEVSNTAARVTIWIAIIATLTGCLDLINVFHWSAAVEQWAKWGITVGVAIINIISKQLFPSELQKDNVFFLKQQK